MLQSTKELSDNLMALVLLYMSLVGPMPHLWGTEYTELVTKGMCIQDGCA